MALYDFFAIDIKQKELKVIAREILKAKKEARNDDFVNLLKRQRRLEKEIEQMKRS